MEGSLCHQDCGKGKVVPVRAMKAFRASRDVAAIILNPLAGDELSDFFLTPSASSWQEIRR
jgi:hypothetical protein